jgi:hypothetical protein
VPQRVAVFGHGREAHLAVWTHARAKKLNRTGG